MELWIIVYIVFRSVILRHIFMVKNNILIVKEIVNWKHDSK